MPSNDKKTKFALIGTGSRAMMFIEPIVTTFKKTSELVALSDTNPTRLQYYNNLLKNDFDQSEVPTYDPKEFSKMIKDTNPDKVIVTTIDSFHDEYIIKSMEHGCDVITEKPMTINAEKCQNILKTIDKTGKKLRVALNYRWSAGATQIKKLINTGLIGKVLHVDMEYWLNTNHGADYFRRWHRQKNNSGGLIVHKSSHHFDLINWWINSVPDSVFAMGQLSFYGEENASLHEIDPNQISRYQNLSTKNDPFALDLNSDDKLKKLYLDAETHDGYIRDQNVFSKGITTEDSVSVLVKYRNGTLLNYSLNAYLPREGYRVAFNGSKGRLEYEEIHPNSLSSNKNLNADEQPKKWEGSIKFFPNFGNPQSIDLDTINEGSHGGGDSLLQNQIFSKNQKKDILNRDAGHEQGAASILIGIAANESMKTKKAVKISNICPQLDHANFLNELE